MSVVLTALSRDALVLPLDEQLLLLARQLLESLDLVPEPSADAAWEAAIASRVARYDAGESRGIPAGEVFERLRKIAPVR